MEGLFSLASKSFFCRILIPSFKKYIYFVKKLNDQNEYVAESGVQRCAWVIDGEKR